MKTPLLYNAQLSALILILPWILSVFVSYSSQGQICEAGE